MKAWRRSLEVEIDNDMDHNCREDTRTTVVIEDTDQAAIAKQGTLDSKM